MNIAEIIELVEMLKKFPEERQREFLYMIKSAALVAERG